MQPFLFSGKLMSQYLIAAEAHWRTKAILFLLSQEISLFGSSAVGFALVWHILQTTSGLWITIATIACPFPQVLLLLCGGVWAVRYNRRLLIILSDAFVALVTLGLAVLFICGMGSLWLLIGALTFRSLGSGIQTPSSAAIYPQIIAPAHFSRLQAIIQTANAVPMLLSPAVSGLLLGATYLALVMFIDVVTAFLMICTEYLYSIAVITNHTIEDEI